MIAGMSMDATCPPPRTAAVRRIGLVLLSLAITLAGIDFLAVAWSRYHDLASQAYAMFAGRRGWLWLHVGAGVVTLLLGPAQFVGAWRRRWPRVHRWFGRVYLVAILVGSAAAAGLIATSPAPASIRAAFAGTALAWLATGLGGYVAIRRGMVGAHRRWMAGNYAVTLAPVSFRVALRVAVAAGVAPTPALIAMLLTLSWLLPLAACEAARRLSAWRPTRRDGDGPGRGERPRAAPSGA